LFRVFLLLFDVMLVLHYTAGGRWRWFAAALIILLVLFTEAVCYTPMIGSTFNGNSADRVKVLTFNVRFFFPGYFQNTLKWNDVDLACFEEVKKKDVPSNLFGNDSEKNGYYAWFGEIAPGAEDGLLIISKKPIELTERIRCPSLRDEERFIYIVKTRMRGRLVNVVGLHLEPVSLKEGLRGAVSSWAMRLKQARLTAAAARRLEGPVIIVGDFNSTPTDRVVRTLKRGFRDAGREAGKFPGSTWHQDAPVLRIDYILYRGFKAASDVRLFRYGHSDHMFYMVDLYQ